MAEDSNKTKKKTTKPKTNTMNIELINSTDTKITITGNVTDREIKAICRAINHTPDQKVEAKANG